MSWSAQALRYSSRSGSRDFIISPDPAVGPGSGPGAGGRPAAAGDVLIVAALPDPLGPDPGRESVTVMNTTASSLDLTGWAITDGAGSCRELSGALSAGGGSIGDDDRGPTGQLRRHPGPGGRAGRVVDQLAYQANQVRPGRTICFGR